MGADVCWPRKDKSEHQYHTINLSESCTTENPHPLQLGPFHYILSLQNETVNAFTSSLAGVQTGTEGEEHVERSTFWPFVSFE